MRVRQVVRLVWPGVPRLYAAAREAGGRWLAVRTIFESLMALIVSIRSAPMQPRQQNAVRHFIWSARMTCIHSAEFARTVGDLHELGSADPVDSEVDQRNNAVGREYAEARLAELTGLGLRGGYGTLLRAARRHWRRGQLWTDMAGQVAASG